MSKKTYIQMTRNSNIIHNCISWIIFKSLAVCLYKFRSLFGLYADFMSYAQAIEFW